MEATRETANLKELAYMRRRPVEGRSTRSTSSRVVTSRAHHRQANYQVWPAAVLALKHNSPLRQVPNDNKSLDFVYYSDSEDETEAAEVPLEESSYAISCNFVDCLSNRERGCDRKFQTMRLASEYGTRHMLSNAMLKEYPVTQTNVNKVGGGKAVLSRLCILQPRHMTAARPGRPISL
jgi:hypothetical protein